MGTKKQTQQSVNLTGKIKFYNSNKGYGFVINDEDAKEYFLHATGIDKGIKQLKPDDVISFELTQTDKGLKAINVQLI